MLRNENTIANGRRSEINDGMAGIDSAINQTEKLVADLMERLQPVLRSIGPMAGQIANAVAKGPETPVGASLLELDQRLRKSNDDLESILGRLAM